ncbi:hypothetical protein [Spirosoma agri]|uniref:DoxX family membrane protein n=1 Tax=Spirosoma agri TaxID=1987381 RepID=A0A6M0IQN0_9BACT|nr:hypothetical protein [Spirosoma agri]NEU69825.1 hypothetical protein [Spirosoma agri]
MFRLIDALRSKTWACLFVIFLRYLIGGAFVYAGWGKALGGRFMPAGTLQLPPDHGISIDLFFEALYRTGIWWNFLGVGQVIAGALLVTQRFATLGAVAFLPISLNVFVITISMDFHFTPVLTGLIVAANLGLLLWDYQKIAPLFYPNRAGEMLIQLRSDQLGSPGYWQGLGLLILLTSSLFGNRENALVWFPLCLAEGLLGLVGFFIVNRRQQKCNPDFRAGKPNNNL